MVFGPVGKYAILALGAVLLIFFLVRSREVGIGNAASEIGNSFGSIGQGIGQLGSGIGTGLSGLFNPAYTVLDLAQRGRNLIFQPQQQPQGQQQAARRQERNDMDPPGAQKDADARTQAQINAAILRAHPRGTFGARVGTFFSDVNTPTALTTELRSSLTRLLASRYFEGSAAGVQSLADYYRSLASGVVLPEQLRTIEAQLGRRGRR